MKAMKIETKLITPNMARAWLQTNRNNRHVSKFKVMQYAADMRAGRWQVSSQGIVFDHDGNLIDGQHRLLAIIKADCSVVMSVITNAPPSSVFVIDTGKKRSGSDALEMLNIKNASNVASGINMLCVLLNDNRKSRHPLPNDLIQIMASRIGDEMSDAAAAVRAMCRAGTTKTKTIYLALYFCCRRVFGHEKTEKIFNEILAGYGLQPRTRTMSVRKNIIMTPYVAGTKNDPNEVTEAERYTRAIIGLFAGSTPVNDVIKKFRATFTREQLQILDYRIGQMEMEL